MTQFVIKTLKDWKPGDNIKAMVFARSKAGKTWGALTFPRPCVMDFDKGIATGRNPEFVKKYGLRDVIYEQFTEKKRNTKGIVTTHNAFDDACLWYEFMMSPANIYKFDTWVIDTGTSLATFAMNKAYILLGGTAIKASSATLHEAKTEGVVIPKIQDYGAERSMVEQFVAMVLDSDKHVLFLCHEKEISDKQGNPTDIVPLLTGKGVEAISAMFDEIWNLRNFKAGTEIRRVLQTQADGLRRCGSRYGVPSIDPVTTTGGIPFEWDAINKALGEIRAAQNKESS